MELYVQPENGQPEQLSQPCRLKHRLEFEWLLMLKVDQSRAFQVLHKGEYKMSKTHSNATRNCTFFHTYESPQLEILILY